MSDGFRLAGHIKEFTNDLKKLRDEKFEFVIWQSTNGKKIVVDGTLNSFGREKEEISIRLNVSRNIAFNCDSAIYIFQSDKNMLFKGEFKFCVNKVLQVIAEDKVFLKEKRKAPRIRFNYIDIIGEVSIASASKPGIKEKKLELVDISELGMGLFISSENASEYLVGDKVTLNAVHGIKFPKSISGNLKHISPAQTIKMFEGKVSQLGVEFEVPSKLIGIVAVELAKAKAV